MYQVMIVDDEMLERMALGKKLKKHFGDLLQIVQAENGIEAVRTFKKLRPRIVIMDIGMPGMNGVSAAEVTHELDRQAVIISSRPSTSFPTQSAPSPSGRWSTF